LVSILELTRDWRDWNAFIRKADSARVT